MADVIVKLRVMPSSTAIDLKKLGENCKKKISEFGVKAFYSVTEEPIAFGLKALDFMFLIDEKNSNTDILEAKAKEAEGVESVQILDVRRAVG